MSLSDEISENKTRVISMYRWNCAAAENLFIGSMEREEKEKTNGNITPPNHLIRSNVIKIKA